MLVHDQVELTVLEGQAAGRGVRGLGALIASRVARRVGTARVITAFLVSTGPAALLIPFAIAVMALVHTASVLSHLVPLRRDRDLPIRMPERAG